MTPCRTCKAPTTEADLEPLYEGYANRRCKYCAQKAARNKKPTSREYHRNYVLKREYGITLDEYVEMAEEQHCECAICKSPASENNHGVLAVDHDHATGNVRGLLCNACNTALGLMKDDPALLIAAADYLNTHLIVGF